MVLGKEIKVTEAWGIGKGTLRREKNEYTKWTNTGIAAKDQPSFNLIFHVGPVRGEL